MGKLPPEYDELTRDEILAMSLRPTDPYRFFYADDEIAALDAEDAIAVLEEQAENIRVLAGYYDSPVAISNPAALPDQPALDQEMDKVLTTLANHAPYLLTQSRLAGLTQLHPDTVAKAVHQLATIGLCHKPGGERSRKGWTVTEAGIELDKSLSAPRD